MARRFSQKDREIAKRDGKVLAYVCLDRTFSTDQESSLKGLRRYQLEGAVSEGEAIKVFRVFNPEKNKLNPESLDVEREVKLLEDTMLFLGEWAPAAFRAWLRLQGHAADADADVQAIGLIRNYVELLKAAA